MRLIESTQNPLVKRLFALRKKAERSRQQRFLVEGKRAITGFFDHGWQAETLLIRSDRDCPADWAAQDNFAVSAAILDKLSSHKQDSGYMAEFAIPAATAVDLAAGGLILHGIADPGNCGTLIRSAAAFGWQQVLLLASVDPYAPKVIQSTVGALAAVRIIVADEGQSLAAFAGQAPLAGLVIAGGQDPRHMAALPRWLVVGSEAHGIPADELPFCDELISIPMHGTVESLNAAVAGSIAACYLGKH